MATAGAFEISEIPYQETESTLVDSVSDYQHGIIREFHVAEVIAVMKQYMKLKRRSLYTCINRIIK